MPKYYESKITYHCERRNDNEIQGAKINPEAAFIWISELVQNLFTTNYFMNWILRATRKSTTINLKNGP